MSLPVKQNLYRKYRPQNFLELVGQDHIVKTIRAAVSSDRISHAYMFSGPRGTGKTSTARLLAKILNCLAPVTGVDNFSDACCKCDNCKRIEELNFMDIIEIDAASNNSVEDIRQMREKVKYKPVEGKYKVYIIDEVHMLSGSAFNAFLKTLEEPPERVLFILATTDPQKVPATIISRCQCFDFHSVSRKVIQKRLGEICKLERDANPDIFPEISDEALAVIAESAQGGFRDALSLLDQISSSAIGGSISFESVLEMTRRLSYQTLTEIASNVFNAKHGEIIKVLNELFFKGYEAGTIARDLLEFLRRCMILKIDANANNVLELPEEQAEEIKSLIKDINSEFLILAASKMESIINRLRYSQQARILLETELVKLSLGEKFLSIETLEKRVDQLETKIGKLSRLRAAPVATKQVTTRTGISEPQPTAVVSRPISSGPFEKFKSALASLSKICSALLVNAKFMGVEAGCAKISVDQGFAAKRLKEAKNIELMIQAAKDSLPGAETIQIITPDMKTEKKSLNKAARVNHKEQIAKIDEKARQKILQKPPIADAVEVFGGEIIDIQ